MRTNAILLVLMSLVSGFLAYTIGLFEIPDSYFYVVLGTFLTNGVLLPIYPFHYIVPSTLYGPFYSILVTPITNAPFPWNAFLIPFIQLMLLGIGSMMLYHAMRFSVGKSWARIGAVLFLILPFNIIYATTLMTETLATFFMVLTLFSIQDYFSKKPTLWPSLLVFISCLSTLTRNANVLLLPISLILWIYDLYRIRRSIWKTPFAVFVLRILPLIIGLAGIFWWMHFNYQYHGVWQLTINTGRHLYNNVVHAGHILPLKNSREYIEFTKRVPENELFSPEYELHKYFASEFNAGTLKETDVDRIFLQFSVAAIRNKPMDMIGNIFRTAYGNLTTAPYYRSIMSYMGFVDPQCTDCEVSWCRFMWNFSLCTPILSSPFINTLWKNYLLFNLAMYPSSMLLLSALALYGIIISITQRIMIGNISAGMFLLFLFTVSSMQRVEGRYLIPLYPYFSVLIIIGIRGLTTVLYTVPKKVATRGARR